jgi:hypothetical protein
MIKKIVFTKNSTDSNLIFSFFTIFSFAIFYYFSKGSGIPTENFILLAGYVLCYININIFKFRYIYCLSTLIALISLNVYIFFLLISFSGYIILIYLLLISKNTFSRSLISLAFIIIYTFSYSFDGEGNIQYLRSLFDLHHNDLDLFFHSSVASHYKTYDHCTTGVHGLNSFRYWDLSNLICSNLSKFLNIRSIDFYSFLYPSIIMPLLLKYSNDLVYRISDELKVNKNVRYNHAISISLLVSLSFLTLHPYFGPVQNFLKWPCHRTFNLLIAFTISLKFILVLTELIRDNKLFYSKSTVAIITIFYVYIITNCKFFFIYFILLSSFILCFFQTPKEKSSRIKIIFISTLTVFLYFNFFISTKSSSHFDFQPFHIWKINANEHHTLWSPFSLGFPLVLIVLLSNNNFYLKDLFIIQKLRSKKYIIFTILILSFLMSLAPTFILGGEMVRNLLYLINTYYFFLSIPFAIVLTGYLSTINFKNLSFNNLIVFLFLFLALLHSSSTAIINFYNKYTYYKETLYSNKSTNDSYHDIIQLNNTLLNLSKTKLPDSVLWVPKTNKDAWKLIDSSIESRQPALPFIFSSLSELPLIYGFPNLPDELFFQVGYGFASFNKIPRNLDSDLNQSIFEAKRLGFDYLYVLNSLSELTLHKI